MTFEGVRVLVVEDEMLVAMNLEDMLVDMGAVVIGPAMRIDFALELAESEEIDIAVLDINLHGGRSYPVAEVLRRRGVPFLFATGYGHAEDEAGFADVPTLAKPYRRADLAAIVERVMRARG